jgi:hypothetical protein
LFARRDGAERKSQVFFTNFASTQPTIEHFADSIVKY